MRPGGQRAARASRATWIRVSSLPPPELIAERVREENITEVILALNATIDGQTTAHYITDRLEAAKVKISELAHGVPVGGELDYLDDGTLSAALKQRREV